MQLLLGRILGMDNNTYLLLTKYNQRSILPILLNTDTSKSVYSSHKTEKGKSYGSGQTRESKSRQNFHFWMNYSLKSKFIYDLHHIFTLFAVQSIIQAALLICSLTLCHKEFFHSQESLRCSS